MNSTPTVHAAKHIVYRHAAGLSLWTWCGLPAVTVHVDLEHVTCPGCMTAPPEFHRRTGTAGRRR